MTRAARTSPRKADLTRVLKAIQQTGERMALEVLPDGTIRAIPVEPIQPVKQPTKPQKLIVL